VVFLYIYGKIAFPLLLLIPLVCWARVILKRHTIAQVIVGTLLTGVLSIFILYYSHLYIRFIRPNVIFDILGLSITGNINISMFFTVLFIVLASQFRKAQINY
jgi:membrane-associated phospholipid phosphatase